MDITWIPGAIYIIVGIVGSIIVVFNMGAKPAHWDFVKKPKRKNYYKRRRKSNGR